ncbi:hypothetical protein [Cognatishimia maritima]|uniref:Uncharacterized protein n=1 Tax=Cognatishimia maritima TaxID=870908 RepID=A0A1M5KM81_9RHOB|nr:hypothetical protein [Cognatishimia maritima]SHG53897.1 hypothetical protein SAMN04488044_1017 [Cognatishimia maritima]
MKCLRQIATLVSLGFAAPASAESCQTLEDLHAGQTARELAGIVRDCVAQERNENAIEMFWAYSNFSLFDQQRVWDESAHVAVQELHVWIFSGYSFDTINALKAVIARLREPNSAFLAETCKAVAKAGPPDYRPTYMITRGLMPRKSDDDWLTEGFDADAAWQKALVEINGCPEGTL